MSVIWKIFVTDDGENELQTSLVRADTHTIMIDALRARGFKRILKDDVPYQLPTMAPAEFLYFEYDGVRLEAWHFEPPKSSRIQNIPNAREIVEFYKNKTKDKS